MVELFKMPAELPGTAKELDALTERVSIEITVIADFAEAGPLPVEIMDHLEYLLDSRDTLTCARRESEAALTAAAAAAEQQRQRQASERLVLAVHESGHAICSVILGGEVLTAEVFRPDRGEPFIDRDGRQLNGQCRMVPSTTVTGARGHLIAAAGPAAEAIARYGHSPTRSQIDRVLKGQKDAEVMQRYALTAGAYAQDPVREVMPLVLRCWPAIVQLAVQMDDGQAVEHSDVTAALGLSPDRSLHAFECANIRAGLRSVPLPA